MESVEGMEKYGCHKQQDGGSRAAREGSNSSRQRGSAYTAHTAAEHSTAHVPNSTARTTLLLAQGRAGQSAQPWLRCGAGGLAGASAPRLLPLARAWLCRSGGRGLHRRLLLHRKLLRDELLLRLGGRHRQLHAGLHARHSHAWCHHLVL